MENNNNEKFIVNPEIMRYVILSSELIDRQLYFWYRQSYLFDVVKKFIKKLDKIAYSKFDKKSIKEHEEYYYKMEMESIKYERERI